MSGTAGSAVPEPVTAVILAGGEGARLGGREKTALRIGERSLLDIRIAALSAVCARIILVVNRQPGTDYSRLRVIQDLRPGLGPLMGLYTGLLASSTPLNFVTGVDMPFFEAGLFRRLRDLAQEGRPPYDVTVPFIRRQYEPLFAFYRRSCLPALERRLAEERGGSERIVSFFSEVRVRRVEAAQIIPHDAAMISFFNINTLEDLRTARRLRRKQPGGSP